MDQLIPLFTGPFGALVLATVGLGYVLRYVVTFVMDLWHEHLRVDHERAEALVRYASERDAMRASNDANAKVMERAVAQNERLLAAVLGRSRGTED